MNTTQLRSYGEDERVIEEDTSGNILYVVLHGRVGVYKNGILLATLGAGSHFGEMALIDKGVRSATVIAEVPSRFLVIPRRNFIELLRREQNIAVKMLWAFLKVFTGRLRVTTDELSRLKSRGDVSMGVHDDDDEVPYAPKE